MNEIVTKTKTETETSLSTADKSVAISYLKNKEKFVELYNTKEKNIVALNHSFTTSEITKFLEKNIDYFKVNDKVRFFDASTDYRDVYALSSLVVCDYSSAVFDFAYLRKPIVYAQFDAEDFFGGKHTVKKGYFDYERDGFGEVEHDLEATVDRIIEYATEDGEIIKQLHGFNTSKEVVFNVRSNKYSLLEGLKKGDVVMVKNDFITDYVSDIDFIIQW